MWKTFWRRDEPITIEWSGLEFSTRHDRFTSPRWILRDTDWWNGTTQDSDQIRAPRGVWVGTEHHAPRTVSWSGLLECESRDDLIEEMRGLQGAHGTTVRVWETDMEREATCRRSQALVTPISDRYATFSVTVVLDDPLVSSIDEIPVDRSVKVTNRGSVASRPVVRVSASGARPRVSIGSWTVQPSRNLTSGEVFTVDCRTGTLYLGNAAVFPVLTEFPSIAPGATVTVSTSHGSGTVDGVSAWI